VNELTVLSEQNVYSIECVRVLWGEERLPRLGIELRFFVQHFVLSKHLPNGALGSFKSFGDRTPGVSDCTSSYCTVRSTAGMRTRAVQVS
jgi:hypothetical protein